MASGAQIGASPAQLAKRFGVRQLAAAFSGELARSLIGQSTAQRCTASKLA